MSRDQLAEQRIRAALRHLSIGDRAGAVILLREAARHLSAKRCNAPVVGHGQSICTRLAGHPGAHRCSAADIDDAPAEPEETDIDPDQDATTAPGNMVDRWG